MPITNRVSAPRIVRINGDAAESRGTEPPSDRTPSDNMPPVPRANIPSTVEDVPNATPLSILQSTRHRELLPPVFHGNVTIRSRDDLAKLEGYRSLKGTIRIDIPDLTEADF